MIGFRDWQGKSEPADDVIEATVRRLLADPNTEFLLGGSPPTGVCQLRYRLSVWTGTDDCCLEDLFVEADGARVGAWPRAGGGGASSGRASAGCARIDLDANEANAAGAGALQVGRLRQLVRRRRAATTCSCGCVSDFVDLVADRDPAGLDDVGAQSGAVHHALEDARVGEALDVVARLAPLGSHGLDLADAEALAEQVVQPDAAW